MSLGERVQEGAYLRYLVSFEMISTPGTPARPDGARVKEFTLRYTMCAFIFGPLVGMTIKQRVKPEQAWCMAIMMANKGFRSYSWNVSGKIIGEFRCQLFLQTS